MRSSFRSDGFGGGTLARACRDPVRRLLLVPGDPLGDELRVVLDKADQRRSARVLPGESEEVEARNLRDPAAMPGPTALLQNR